MRLRVVLRPEASRDAEEARDYFEGQQAGLGKLLLTAFKKRCANRCRPGDLRFRLADSAGGEAAAVHLVVYYRVVEDKVEVLAVLHGSREAAGWKSRL